MGVSRGLMHPSTNARLRWCARKHVLACSSTIAPFCNHKASSLVNHKKALEKALESFAQGAKRIPVQGAGLEW